MPNILDIHIARSIAGKKFPFDKLYLFEKTDAHLIGKIFGYAVVMPMSLAVRAVLRMTQPRTISHKGFRRNDAGKNIPLEVTKANAEDWWKAFEVEHNIAMRLVVIPVLTTNRRKKQRPRYLGTRNWDVEVKRSATHGRNLPQYFNETAYLATPYEAPHDKVVPICSICPRMLAHLNGECNPGDYVCYKSLDFSRVSELQDASLQSDYDIYPGDA